MFGIWTEPPTRAETTAARLEQGGLWPTESGVWRLASSACSNFTPMAKTVGEVYARKKNMNGRRLGNRNEGLTPTCQRKEGNWMIAALKAHIFLYSPIPVTM